MAQSFGYKCERWDHQLCIPTLERFIGAFEAPGKQMWAEEIVHQKAYNAFLFSLYPIERTIQLQLFDRPDYPLCDQYYDSLDCHRDLGHHGPHYDNIERIQWNRT